MNTKEETKIKILAELATGATPKDLAHKYKTPYVTILGWKKKYEKERQGQADVEVLTSTDLPILHAVAERVKEEAPASVARKIDKLVEGVTALEQLEPKFHTVTLKLLEAAEEMASRDDLTVKDWSTLSAGIGGLYASIFNKSGVNVNVMNQTNVNNEKLSMFKGSLRG